MLPFSAAEVGNINHFSALGQLFLDYQNWHIRYQWGILYSSPVFNSASFKTSIVAGLSLGQLLLYALTIIRLRMPGLADYSSHLSYRDSLLKTSLPPSVGFMRSLGASSWITLLWFSLLAFVLVFKGRPGGSSPCYLHTPLSSCRLFFQRLPVCSLHHPLSVQAVDHTAPWFCTAFSTGIGL